MKLKSKFFRIAVAGATTDGRVIEADWLTQMAKNYNPEKYTARINCEHMRGYSPESAFGMYGNVVALKTEEVEITGEKQTALFAAIEPTPELVTLNRKGQKLFTSMEIDPDFAKKGEFYLAGLAITDSPASLGTEMLQFAAKAEKNPLADRKQKPENMFSVTTEAELEFNEESTLAERIAGMFKKTAADQGKDNEQFTQAIEAIGQEVVNLSETVAALKPAEGKDYSTQITDLTEKLTATTDELSDLKKQLKETPNFSARPPASGGKGEVETDC